MTSHADTLTALHYAAIRAAGSDFSWPDVRGTVDSKHRRGLAAWLIEQQRGLCAACGDSLVGDAVEICHIVASRRKGLMTPGNVYAGHKGCNDDDSKVYGDIVPLESLVRIDLVPTALPTRQDCHRIADEVSHVRESRRARRLAQAR